MKEIIKKIKEKIQNNVLIYATLVLIILAILSVLFEFLQKLKK